MPQEQAIAAETQYPPEPWRLTGELQASVWLLRKEELRFHTPVGWRPVSLFGRCLVSGVWATYGWDGDLAYRELAVGVLMRRGLRLAVTLPWIWVDDRRALEGGRRLWNIPKQLARFPGNRAQDDSGAELAAVEQRRIVALPGRWPVGLRIVQAAEAGEAVLTPARAVGRLALGAGRWRAAGPLAFLDGRKPLLTVRLERAVLRFGQAGRL